LLDLDDRVVAARLEDLRRMGLTRPEAVVYTVLVCLGPSRAKDLHAVARHSREETYRILKDLESKGLVEARLEKPTIFTAVDPDTTIDVLISRIKKETQERTKNAKELGTWLEDIRGPTVEEGSPDQGHHVKLLHGHQATRAGNAMIRNCRTSCMVVTTAGWLSKMNEVGNLEPLASASEEGVKVRIVTEVTSESIKYARNYGGRFEIRHHLGVNRMVRLMLCDDSAVMFALSENEDVEGLLSLYSDSTPMVEGFKLIFEKLWADAIPATEVVIR
jgi:HTH-type transcriptional regulator, sugar sensing transcriptional regulator